MSSALAAYLRERFQPAVYGPLIVLLASAALWASPATLSPQLIGRSIGMATLLALQFRIWDDLEDRELDRVVHPRRVLVVSESTLGFRVALLALATTNLAWVAWSSRHGSVAGARILVVFDLVSWLAYRRLRSHIPEPVWRFGILLAKYPLFVVVLTTAETPPTGPRLVFAALAVYTVVAVYEGVHERSSFEESTDHDCHCHRRA